MPGFLEFSLHGNVSRIAITYGYFSRPVIVVSYIMYHPKVIFVIGVGVTAIALPHCCFGLRYLFLCIRYDIRAQWQTPGGANPRRGAHIHTFQVPHGSGRRVFAAPFHVGPVNSQGQACSRTSPVIERGPFPEPGLVGLLANGPRGEHEKRRLQRTAFAKKQPPVIGSLPLYFYVNIYGYLIMQPSPPLLHLLRQGQACTQALSP